MSIILKAENISKQYRLGTVGAGTLGDDLKRLWYSIRGKEDPFLNVGAENMQSSFSNEDYVWALRDINFEVKDGEVLGIIGKNGAGKSTLLKILSRVTSPTTGSIGTKGRIASLLEVGTGFHGELTGRENIFMNGAVLGMTRNEIKSKLDEIIAFSGCEKYIDTPVKRYSSGMTVRLGFAVAAHLEPEILVVDEVLAVGDVEFQKKAIGKMQDLSTGEGRTVLFVSHNMASVKNLCSKAVLLRDGRLHSEGEVNEITENYLDIGKPLYNKQEVNSFENRNGNGMVQVDSIFIYGNTKGELPHSGGNLHIEFSLDNPKGFSNNDIKLGFRIDDNIGQRLIWYSTSIQINKVDKVIEKVKFSTKKCVLNMGTYYITVYISVNDVEADWIQNAMSFDVSEGYYYASAIQVPPSQSKLLTDFQIDFE